MAANEVALRKRTQIAKANRTMFIWIAVASALIGTAAVVSIFFFQQLVYNEKVLAEKLNTVSTLDANLAIVEDLQNEIKALSANSALASAKASESEQPLQVILDALPSEANSLALGASLQQRLLTGIQGNYTLENLQVDQVSGVEVLGDSASDSDTVGQITFSFGVSGDQAALRQVLENLERSIRTIEVTSLTVEMSGNVINMRVEGRAFYEPAKTIELETIEVKP
tara:strand:+ start:10969 stop:11646 length:678 start_codon:yes stop_codon:yes gene_type:complete